MLSIFGNDKDDKSKERKDGGSLFDRLKQSVSKTRSQIASKVEDLISGEKKIDPEMLTKLENVLLAADLGPRTTHQILEAVRQRLERHALNNASDLRAELKSQLLHVLRVLPSPNGSPAAAQEARPHVIFVVGVNGTGKTTTIGKLAYRLRQSGKNVVLAAGDTFRAAAIDQLKIWAGRTGAAFIARETGADAAGLVFDAVTDAKARGVDVLLIDTAGRLQNRAELMNELEKVLRVMKKVDASVPHAVLLVLDATVGQNALSQVEIFQKIAGVTGLVMTKLDGTARGGILVALAAKFKLPVHFIGVGENVEDLAPFSAREFSRAIAGLDSGGA